MIQAASVSILLSAAAAVAERRSQVSLRAPASEAAAGTLSADAAHEAAPPVPLATGVPAAVQQHLRICNGYASRDPVIVLRAPGQVLGNAPLGYKQCQDVLVALEDGDRLDFRDGSSSIGSFTTSDVPRTTSSLLLVLHRRDSRSAAVAFQSHSYSDLGKPQVAAIDAYHGPSKSHLQIAGAQPPADNSGGETDKNSLLVSSAEYLQYSSVFAVNPGQYNVSLLDEGKVQHQVQLDAAAGKEYVVMRVGLGGGGEFPEELVVFGATAPRSIFGMLVLAALLGYANGA